jgi:hypothetical protein
MTWTVSLGKTRWNKPKVITFPPEVIVVAQEGYKL